MQRLVVLVLDLISVWLLAALPMADSSSSSAGFSSSPSSTVLPQQETTLNCSGGKSGFALHGKLYGRFGPNDGMSGVPVAGGGKQSRTSYSLFFPNSADVAAVSADQMGNNVSNNEPSSCVYDSPRIFLEGRSKFWLLFAVLQRSETAEECIKQAIEAFKVNIDPSSKVCLVILKRDSVSVQLPTLMQKLFEWASTTNLAIFVAEGASEADQRKAVEARNNSDHLACVLPARPQDDDQLPQDSLLNNFSRTSVLFVSVSFIILMVISLAWLVFYYVQRFRYAHAKDRLARRLFNAAKKALTKIPAKALRHGDKELDSDCPVCIEPYHANDVIRILPCKHVFHKTCVDPWLLEHRTCPMCKMDILKAFGYHFGHSEESVRDADQLSAGGQSTDGGSGETGAGGRHGSDSHHGFPISLPTDSDLHDPFFPSPIPSPSLLQPVLHSNNAPNFSIIPLTVHHQHGGSSLIAVASGARRSNSSADSGDTCGLNSGGIRRQHSAEVHHGAGVGADADSAKTPDSELDSNHNSKSAGQQRRVRQARELSRRLSTCSSSNSCSPNGTPLQQQQQQQQQQQSLFHSRSAGALSRKCSTSMSLATAQQRRSIETGPQKMMAIVCRGRSASQIIPPTGLSKVRMTVTTAAPTLYSTGVATTVIDHFSSSSLSSTGSSGSSTSSSDCGLDESRLRKERRNKKNVVDVLPKNAASLESL